MSILQVWYRSIGGGGGGGGGGGLDPVTHTYKFSHACKSMSVRSPPPSPLSLSPPLVAKQSKGNHICCKTMSCTIKFFKFIHTDQILLFNTERMERRWQQQRHRQQCRCLQTHRNQHPSPSPSPRQLEIMSPL